MSWRSKKSGKHFPISQKGTLYRESSDQAISDEVHARDRKDAEASAAELTRDFRDAKTRDKKEHVWRATQEEANRLNVGAHNSNNSVEARRRLASEASIFQHAADRMHDDLYK